MGYVEFVKEIIDLTDANNDPKFIKEIIDLTKNNDLEFLKEVIDLKKADSDVEFVSETIDLTRKKRRKNKKKKDPKDKTKSEKQRKKIRDNAARIGKINSDLLNFNLYEFDLKTMLNQSQFFDLNQSTEDEIFDKIIEGVPDNGTYYIKHRVGSPTFTVQVDKKWKRQKEE